MPIDDQLFEPPEDANEALFDAMVRHQIYILRLSGGIRNRIETLLNSTEQHIAEKIRDRLRNSKGLNSTLELKRLETLLGIIRKIRTKAWENATAAWTEELTALAKSEPELLRSMVVATSPVVVEAILPSTAVLKSIVTSSPFEGRTLKQWAQQIAVDDIKRIESQIRVGMVSGETSAQIARRVVGTAALKGTDGATEVTRRQAAAITRTATNYVANEARDLFFKENSDLFEEELFVATLDSRTTAVCRANDGKKFPVGKGPRPPLHWNCRSLRVALLTASALGDRPFKPTTERMLLKEFTAQNKLDAVTKRGRLPRGTKTAFDKFARQRTRELVGQVPAATTYQQWLKRQSSEFQNDVLGKTKARLFRDGKLTLDKFVNRAGDELTLGELAKRHAAAFKAAGLDPAAFLS